MTGVRAIVIEQADEMHSRQFSPGFRLSTIDVAVLVIGAVSAVALWNVTWWWGFVIAFVLSHFFLFCNLFRIARPLELAWAGIFVVLAAATLIANTPGWPVTTFASLSATVVVVMLEMRKPSYHGICWQRINPGLPAWWKLHAAGTPGGGPEASAS